MSYSPGALLAPLLTAPHHDRVATVAGVYTVVVQLGSTTITAVAAVRTTNARAGRLAPSTEMQTAVSVTPASTAGNMTTVTGPGVLGGVGSTVSGGALLLLLSFRVTYPLRCRV